MEQVKRIGGHERWVIVGIFSQHETAFARGLAAA
jgi:hypothetical protein